MDGGMEKWKVSRLVEVDKWRNREQASKVLMDVWMDVWMDGQTVEAY